MRRALTRVGVGSEGGDQRVVHLRLNTDGSGREYLADHDCKLWGFGNNAFSELLQPKIQPALARYYTPVDMTPSLPFDPADIRSIQAGATGVAAGFAVLCKTL